MPAGLTPVDPRIDPAPRIADLTESAGTPIAGDTKNGLPQDVQQQEAHPQCDLHKEERQHVQLFKHHGFISARRYYIHQQCCNSKWW